MCESDFLQLILMVLAFIHGPICSSVFIDEKYFDGCLGHFLGCVV